MKCRLAILMLIVFLENRGTCRTHSVAAVAPDATIPFELNPEFRIILIQVWVNGRLARVVVDTGSSNTVLSAEFLRVDPLLLRGAGAPVKGSAMTAPSGWALATIGIGKLCWPNQKVLVRNGFSEISKSTKEKVDGIIGEDLLHEFGTVLIDYKTRRLLLQR
jgi:hypothetical protein